MTEILDSDDAREPDDDVDLVDDSPSDSKDEVPHEPGRWAAAWHSVADPAALAVAAMLAVLCAAAVGPSYVFQSYPFNQGIGSLNGVFNLATSTELRPLHDFLVNAAPTIGLLAVALLCACLSVVRVHSGSPAWVRPVAGGALIVTLSLGVLVAAGGYRASTLDLTVPTTGASGTA